LKSILISLSLFGTLLSQSFNPDLLNFQVSLEKDTFLLDEPIFVEMKETNDSKIDVKTSVLNIEFRDYLYIRLISPDGENLNTGPGTVHGLYNRPSSGNVLKQRESRYYVFRLNYYFGNKDPRDYAIHTRYLPAGTYTLQITHFTNANYMYERIHGTDHSDVNKMPAVSNELSFTVIQPTGSKEQERKDYMYAIQQNILNRRDDKSLAYEHLKSFYLKYPNSPYLPYVLCRSFYIKDKDINGERFLTGAEVLDLTKHSYSSFLFRGYVKSLYPDLADDKRYITPNKIAAERSAITYAGSKLGIYLKAEAQDMQYSLDRIHDLGKEERRYK